MEEESNVGIPFLDIEILKKYNSFEFDINIIQRYRVLNVLSLGRLTTHTSRKWPPTDAWCTDFCKYLLPEKGVKKKTQTMWIPSQKWISASCNP